MKTLKFIIPIFLFTVVACNGDETQQGATNIDLSLKSEKIVESNNNFGFDFFETVIENEDSDINLMVSPLSVSQALCLALNGAANTTFDEMQSVLDFDNMSISNINDANLELYDALASHDPNVEFTIANSAWYRDDFSIKSDYVSNLEKYFYAEVDEFDISDLEAAKDKMNKWVKNNTNKKIDEIVESIDNSSILFLINAIYFNGEWSSKFDKSETTDVDFTIENGTTKKVETMIGEASISYINEETYSAVKLPYSYGKYDMVVFLPAEDYTTSDIVHELSDFDFDKLFSLNTSTQEIWVPKFTFEYKNELNDELHEMGMPTAFTGNANFSGISDLSIHISKVLHKTYIKVDEEGTEAAAATSVEMEYTSSIPSEPIKINRSFLFAIVEEDTNSILFIGRVADPSL